MDHPLEAFGVGPTAELCLRVSAAALVQVIFSHPETGQIFLALERKAALHSDGASQTVSLAVQPFGGGARLNRPSALLEQIGRFHFDSPRSREEQDFRILIRPENWETVKRWCLNQFRSAQADALENNPQRELAEELMDALQMTLFPVQYRLTRLGQLVENEPIATGNRRAAQLPTVRIYTIFEALLLDPALIQRVLANSADISNEQLIHLAEADARKGGQGRANAIHVLPLEQLTEAYLNLPPVQRSSPLTIAGQRLEGNVVAVLPEIPVPRYERFRRS